MLFKITFFYLKAIFYYKLGIKRNRKFYYAGKHLFNISQRLPQKAQSDNIILFRILKRSLLKPFLIKSKVDIIDITGNTILFNPPDQYFNSPDQYREDKVNYVKYFSNDRIKIFISSKYLRFIDSINEGVAYFIWLLLMICPFFLLSVISKNKSAFPIVLDYIVEFWGLFKLIKQHHINKLIYFHIYENSSNINALILMNSGVCVNKVAAVTPLSFENSIIISNIVSFCCAYHKEEFKYFEKQMFVNKTQMWGPERMLEVEHLYRNNNTNSNNNIIGFYSSAQWLRGYLGHNNWGHDQVKEDDNLLNYLVEYADNKQDVEIHIYTHPLERTKEHLNLTIKHYKENLKSKKCKMVEGNFNSTMLFDKCNIGISFMSAILFERLYFGFKTIITPFKIEHFPIKNSTIANICVIDKNELFTKLDESLPLNRKEFFKKNNLLEYSPYL